MVARLSGIEAGAEDIDPDGQWTPEAYAPAQNDVTSTATLAPETQREGRLLAKEEGVVAGLPLAVPREREAVVLVLPT